VILLFLHFLRVYGVRLIKTHCRALIQLFNTMISLPGAGPPSGPALFPCHLLSFLVPPPFFFVDVSESGIFFQIAPSYKPPFVFIISSWVAFNSPLIASPSFVVAPFWFLEFLLSLMSAWTRTFWGWLSTCAKFLLINEDHPYLIFSSFRKAFTSPDKSSPTLVARPILITVIPVFPASNRPSRAQKWISFCCCKPIDGGIFVCSVPVLLPLGPFP